MSQTYYIDTRLGGHGPFSPPVPVDDYIAWLAERYDACQYQDGEHRMHYGTAQKFNELVLALNNGATAKLLGDHANELAAVLEGQAPLDNVEVLA